MVLRPKRNGWGLRPSQVVCDALVVADEAILL